MSSSDLRIGNAVLGCLLLEPSLFQELDDLHLSGRHFYYLQHQLIFQAARQLWANEQPVDLITVEAALVEKGQLEDVGGTEFLNGLFDVIPTTANFRHYVDKLFKQHEDWSKKVSVQTALKLLEEGNSASADYLLQQAIDISEIRKPGPKKFPVESFADMNQDLSIPPLVEEILDTETVNVLYGGSNTGKSFVALDLSFCIATGRPWAGRRTLQGGVVYVAAESPGSIRRRVMALRTVYRGIDHSKVPLWMVPVPVDLVTNNEGVDDLIATVRDLQRRHSIRLVVVDTLACTMAGGDENSFETMGALAARLGRLRAECKTAVLGVHHAGKDADRGARGHSSLRAAVDTELELRVDEGLRSVSVTKARDGELGARIGFELVPVSIGVDANGTNVQVPTVNYLAAGATTPLPVGRTLDVLDAGLAALRAADRPYITLAGWEASYLADDEATKGLSQASAKRTFTRQVNRLVPVWFTRSDAGFYPTKAARHALSERVHTITSRDRGQDIVDTTVIVPGQHPEDTRTSNPPFSSDTPGQRRDTVRHGSDIFHDGGPDSGHGQVVPPFIRGDNVRLSDSPVLESEDEREARERLESIRPKTG